MQISCRTSAERIAKAASTGSRRRNLVNNAGGSRPFKIDASEEQWQEALTLNFTRQRQLTQRLLDQMMTRKWGRILNITGKSEPDGINGAFCAKAAVHSWAKGLSREVGRHGITVNCLPPGRIMSEQIRRNYTPEYRQCRPTKFCRRYGEPDVATHRVIRLALAGYITGLDPRRWRLAALSVLSRAGLQRWLFDDLVAARLLDEIDGVQAVLLVLVALAGRGDLLAVGCGQVPAPLASGVLPETESHDRHSRR